MIRKLLCLLGFHQWGEWQEKSLFEGYYDQAFWKERACKACNHIEYIYE